MTTRKRGVPKGVINNPKGANQYVSEKGEGEKDARLQIALSSSDKKILKQAAQQRGMSLSRWLVQLGLEAASEEQNSFLTQHN